jgi:hypothetical protein
LHPRPRQKYTRSYNRTQKNCDLTPPFPIFVVQRLNNQQEMLRNTILFAALMLLMISCKTEATTVTTPETPEVDVPAPNPIVSDTSERVDTSDKTYVLNVVDATIKSPRKELVGKAGDVPLVINYGSPAVNERTIYGDLVPYNKVWRTGANEATRITFSEDVMVGEANKKLPAGTYSLFTLPSSKDEWTVIFNRVADQWGAYDYEESADVVRIKGVSMPATEKAERMDFALDGNTVQLMWDDLVVAFPVANPTK